MCLCIHMWACVIIISLNWVCIIIYVHAIHSKCIINIIVHNFVLKLLFVAITSWNTLILYMQQTTKSCLLHVILMCFNLFVACNIKVFQLVMATNKSFNTKLCTIYSAPGDHSCLSSYTCISPAWYTILW